MSERTYRLMQALIERRVREYQKAGHDWHRMVVDEVSCADRCYPGFAEYCAAEGPDTLNWYDTL